MFKINKILLIAGMVFVTIAQASDTKEIQVKKISSDLYATKDEKLYIKTRYCYQSAYSYEDAILKINNKYGYNIGKIIFESGKTCDIEKLYEEK